MPVLADQYGNFNAAAVLTFAFPLVLFASSLLWLFFQRRRH